MNNDYLTYISHHGILGQRWGIRRYQYKDGSLTPEGKIRYGSSGEYRFNIDLPKCFDDDWEPETKKTTFSERAKETVKDTLRNAFPIISFVVDDIKNRKTKQLAGYPHPGTASKYEKKDGAVETKDQLKRSSKKKNRKPEEYVENINPYYKQPGGINNCVYCSVAMEMNKRGYDVRARRSDIGMTAPTHRSYFKDSKTEWVDTPENYFSEDVPIKKRCKMIYNDICTKLSDYGNGSSGLITNAWAGDLGGHCIYWEVDNNGTPQFYDGQTGKKDNGSFFYNSDMTHYGITRLDNCEVTDNIGEVVVSNKEE